MFLDLGERLLVGLVLARVGSVVLSRATQRDDGIASPLANMRGGGLAKVGQALVDRKLMRLIRTKPGMPVWRIDSEDRQFSLLITAATGDGLLAEFLSAVDAVVCAVTIQRTVALRNTSLPEARRLTLRIGINVGDIIIDKGDIFGDGVNVAGALRACASRADSASPEQSVTRSIRSYRWRLKISASKR
jgi:class 3 adenylate cyclase